MKSRVALSCRLTFAVLALSITACVADAQQISKPPDKNSLQIESEMRSGGNFHSSFASSEFSADGRMVVQGAPFSAVGIKETTQILSDGRRITRRMATTIYRDAQGRTRHEWGNETKAEAKGRFPIISDPVAGALYLGNKRLDRGLQSPTPPKDSPQRKVKIITPQSPPDDITNVIGETIERLGTKTIEGLTVEGVRVTSTIPAAEVAGQQSNKVIYERWYSQELRRNVLLKVIDPRFGEAVYRLTKIDRREPPRELFQIAADSTPTPTSSVERDQEQGAPVSVKLERGGHVSVDNRTTGRIRIIGWDKDTVEATAISERGAEAVRFSVKDGPDRFVWLKADYLRRPEDEMPRPEATPHTEPTPRPEASPATPVSSSVPVVSMPAETPRQIRMPGASNYDGLAEPPRRDGRAIEVHLEVYVPRYAEIDLIKVIRSRVEIMGIETPIVVLGDKSDVVLKSVRQAEVRTRSGGVEIEDAAGFVEVVTVSGPVSVRRAEGDVRVLSISGKIEIECVRGRVNVDSTDGSVALSNVQGDVEANASNSDVSFAGAIREDGRYHLKTMSGTIEMAVRDKAPGFTAALSSYRGTIENDFQLKINQSREEHRVGEVNRRIIGRHGDGQAQITLDSFDGRVKLAKLAPEAAKECKIRN